MTEFEELVGSYVPTRNDLLEKGVMSSTVHKIVDNATYRANKAWTEIARCPECGHQIDEILQIRRTLSQKYTGIPVLPPRWLKQKRAEYDCPNCWKSYLNGEKKSFTVSTILQEKL